MLQENSSETLTPACPADVAKAVEPDGGGLRKHDTLPSRHSSQAGALPSLPLSVALSLLNKHHNSCSPSPVYSPRASNSSRALDQHVLRPIVARFLDSLPSIGKAWSFDAPSTIHSIADHDADAASCADSISVCSVSSCPGGSQQTQQPSGHAQSAALHQQHRLAAQQQRQRQRQQQHGREQGWKQHGHVGVSCRTASTLLLSASTARSAVAEQSSCHSGCQPASVLITHPVPPLPLMVAESIGSAATPSPNKGHHGDQATAAAAAGTASVGVERIGGCSGGVNGPAAAAETVIGRRGVFVGNLPGDVSERALVELFSRCGPIEKLWIARNASNQASLGYGFVVFSACSSQQAIQRAEKELNGKSLQQHPICVRVSTRSF